MRDGEGRPVLALRGLQPIAVGSTRLVFEHPGSPEKLVKVMSPAKLEQYRAAPWYKRLNPKWANKYSRRES
jgi:hypothetical protein